MNKKEKIYAATIEVVEKYGLEGATISKISKKASVSPGIIYHYFETKDEIIHSLALQIRSEFAGIFPTIVESTPIIERYKSIWIRMYKYGLEEPAKLMFMEQYRNSAFGTMSTELVQNDFFKQLFEENRKAIENSVIKDLPINVIFAMTIGVAIEFVKLSIKGIDPFKNCPIEEMAESICASILK